jgi:hypothetical protein
MTYKITQYGTNTRAAIGSDGNAYISHRTPSGRWGRWEVANIVPR